MYKKNFRSLIILSLYVLLYSAQNVWGMDLNETIANRVMKKINNIQIEEKIWQKYRLNQKVDTNEEPRLMNQDAREKVASHIRTRTNNKWPVSMKPNDCPEEMYNNGYAVILSPMSRTFVGNNFTCDNPTRAFDVNSMIQIGFFMETLEKGGPANLLDDITGRYSFWTMDEEKCAELNHINSKVVCAYSVTGIDVVPNTKEMEVAIAFVLKKDEEDNKNKEKTIEVPAEKHMQKSSNKQTVQKTSSENGSKASSTSSPGGDCHIM